MRRRIGIIVAIAAAVVVALGGGSIAWAVWSGNASVSGSVSSGNVSISATGLDKLGQQFTVATTSTTPALVKLTNTGSLAVTGFTGTVSGTSGQALASDITVRIWDAGRNATSCPASVPTGVTPWTGSWATGTIAWPAPATSVPGGGTSYEGYCVISSITSSALTNDAGQTVAPQVTVVGNDGGWTSSATPALSSTFSTPAASPQTVTGSQVGITSTSGVSVSGVSVQSSDGDWPKNPDSDINSQSGQISGQYYFCMVVSVTGQSTSAAPWSFQLDTSAPPFNGTALTNAMFAPSGYQTAQISTFPTGTGTVYTISGLRQGQANTWGQIYNGGSAGPDGYSNYVWNTPITSSQTALVHFCLNVNAPAPVEAAAANTYKVEPATLAGCPGNGNNPAVAGSSSGSASALPGSKGGTACLYIKVDGYYPHFYIGFTATANWNSLVAASGLSSSQKAALLSETPTWALYGSDNTQDSPTPPTLANGIYTWTQTGQKTPQAITNGISVVLLGTFTVPAA
ncbi:hypothetical protein ACFOYW_08035 [Gryllotalpicola reticulitermitis]|uniref:SipW-cognate class signal peptide n=1 Tax=Gryllotalpicola reticulitermitis TaxID=1184153 RepID=A0ABV8Q789_9MICO